MTFFESLLVLLLFAIALLQVARRLSLPYPAMLAGAGVVVALIPGAPAISIEPSTSLALFITPALVDAAYDFPLGATRRFWAPLVMYAVVAVILTTGAVAALAVLLLHLPLAAGVALGAIVAPPDAAAATAVLRKFSLPRRADSILKGESLFNDATALLLFSGALIVLRDGGLDLRVGLGLGFAAPGGLLLGILCAYVVRHINRLVKDTLGGNVLQFVIAYLIWIGAEDLHLSAVLCVIGFAMTLARNSTPEEFNARMRVQSFAVWSSVVFTLNVLAFLVMGMQARSIVARMHGAQLRHALAFAIVVIVAVICIRLFVVLGFSRLEAWRQCSLGVKTPVTFREAFFVGWCGMRGFVTVAAAFALPAAFPQRDTAVLAAFSVVLATLVLQGLTLAPLVRVLKLDRTEEASRDLAAARVTLAEQALQSIADEPGPEADNLRYRLSLWLERCMDQEEGCFDPEARGSLDRLRDLGLKAIESERAALENLRDDDRVGSAEYLGLQEQLDWDELTLLRDPDRQIEEI